MGILLSKFRKKKTTLEILENVEKEIKSIEEFRRDTEQAQKLIVGRFVVISVGTYLLTAFIFYFYFFPADFYDQLFYIIPLIFAPVIIITLKRSLTWYYRRKISRKQNKLIALREEKKKILDQVKETETYKVAKSILDKYAPENQLQTRRSRDLLTESHKTPLKIETPKPTDTMLRQRSLQPMIQQSAFVTPFRPVMQSSSQQQIQGSQLKQLPGGVLETPVPMPREILPRERSVLDKMVDYLMGDGPSNRFALICKRCYSHNGMAHKDEFEYISFRCCYCYVMNLAPKKRPGGPKLESDTKLSTIQTASETSDSEKNSQSESEGELEHHEENTKVENISEPLIQEPMEVDTEGTVEIKDSVETVGDATHTNGVKYNEQPLIDLKD